MPSQPEIYDPIDQQMRTFSGLEAEGFKIEDLTNPTSVKLLLSLRSLNLTELKAKDSELETLRGKVSELSREREDLRIRNAIIQERQKTSWAEILVSIVSGYSINLIATKPNDATGWLSLIVSVAILVVLRTSEALSTLSRITGRGKNGTNYGPNHQDS